MPFIRRSLVASAAALALVLAFAPTPASAAGSLSVSFTTTPNGGKYAPKNIVAVWIENSSGSFVKTIGRWAGTRKSHLVAWILKSGSDADAVSGATRPNHTGTLTVPWDMKDRNGSEVPDGTYTIRMELADSNAFTEGQNHQGTFTFVKGATDSTESTSGGGFENVNIEFTAGADTCNNGTVDPGETCDPPGSCPTACPDTGDACTFNTLVGSASTCTAECVTDSISMCTGGDGCCPAGCDETTDSDCAGGGGGGGGGGGCSTGGGAAGAGAWLLALGLLAIRRRRA
jgi:MYXO-CTERM domain-containing protein